MAEPLPGTMTTDTPEIVWAGVDAPDQLKVMRAGASYAIGTDVNWVQARQDRDGLHTRLFLGWVPAGESFELLVVVPDDRQVHISLRDAGAEYVHSVAVTGGTEQGILRFVPPTGRPGWVVSASYFTRRADEPWVPPNPTAAPNPTLDVVRARVSRTPAAYRGDVEALLLAFPALVDATTEIDMVVDASASMHDPIASGGFDEFARLGWCLALATDGAPLVARLMAQGETRTNLGAASDLDASEPAAWATSVRELCRSGMPTGWPDDLEKTLQSDRAGLFTIALTDAPPVGVRQPGPGWLLVVVAAVDGVPGPLEATCRDLSAEESYLVMTWNGVGSLVAAVLAAVSDRNATRR